MRAPLRFPFTDDRSDDQEQQQAVDGGDDPVAAFVRLGEVVADEAPTEPAFLWRCNWSMWRLWRDLETQWRHAPMGGPTGLDYAAALAIIDRRFRHPRKRREAFYLLQAMEDAALCAYRARLAADE